MSYRYCLTKAANNDCSVHITMMTALWRILCKKIGWAAFYPLLAVLRCGENRTPSERSYQSMLVENRRI
jgi:hypothetical protein